MIAVSARILALVEGRLAAARADRENAASLCRELFALPPAERLAAIVADPTFLSPGLAHQVLDRAEAICERDPGEADHLAAIALVIANRLPPGSTTVERETLLGRSCSWEGEARRVRGDLTGARVALERAFGHFDALPVGEPERAGYCRHLARLRWDEEREDEALALIARAVERYDGLPDLRRAAECRLELAWMLLEAMETPEALPLFERVLAEGEIEEADFDRWLSLRHGLALAYAELRREAAARAVVAEVAGVAAKRLRRDWMRAQLVAAAVAQLLDANDEAEGLLAEAWPALLEEGERHEAMRALVELAQLLAERGRSGEVAGLKERLAQEDLPAPLAEALRLGLDFAASLGPAASEMLEALKLYLRRARHNPEARFGVRLVPRESERVETEPRREAAQ